MKVYNLQLGELRSNCYVIETAPGRCVAVDIGGDSRLLVEFLRMKKLSLRKILLTHGHANIETAMSMIAGTARSMGVTVAD